MPNEDFERSIADFLSKKINYSINRTLLRIQTDITNIIVEAIDKCPEIQSMRGGKLQGELGFISPDHFIEPLFGAIKRSIKIDFQPFHVRSSQLVGNLSVNIISKDYNEFLSLNTSSYVTSNHDEIPWLKWLLLDGGDILIDDYHISFGDYIQSRSNLAIMERGGTYSISTEYQGTADNNFITRALDDSVRTQITNIIKKYIVEVP